MTVNFAMRTEKVCPSCNKMLSRDQFPKNRSRKDGLHAYCKACNRSKQAIDRQQDWHKKMRLKYRTESASGIAAYARYRKAHQFKHKATIAVQNALVSGRLTKPDQCQQCGKKARLDGHHDDYAERLNVRWLCRWCHQEWHRINGEGANAQGTD